MSDYVPTTDEVRDSLVYLNKYYAKQYGDVDLLVVGSETAAQFDRWLAEVEREAAARALEEAARSWLQGEWANTPQRADRIADRMAASQYAGDRLLARAERMRTDLREAED